MKKNLLFFMLLSWAFTVEAQDIDKKAAEQLINKNSALIGLSKDELSNVIISNAYKSVGTDLVYLQQSYLGLPVYNQLQVLAFKNGKLVSNAGGRIREIEKRSQLASQTPVITAEKAVRAAMAEKKIFTSQNLLATIIIPGQKLDFGKLGIAYENITAELMWVPLRDGDEVRLAWQIFLVPIKSSDYWMIRVDANNNKIIGENNLTVYCNWDPKEKESCSSAADDIYAVCDTKNGIHNSSGFNNYSTSDQASAGSPTIVNSASYRVIPFPAESPRHPGGTPTLVTDPWNSAPGNATSLKWHSNGTTDYNITRGNNVWAKEDHPSNNSTTGQPATSTTSPDPLTFNFVPDFARRPNETAPVPNQQFNITNLFYWINVVHDVMYQYGFDEPAGNFQANNQGRGGLGNDFVFGDAQDGNFVFPDQNNANFSTPVDGLSPRMQMYLWDTVATLTVNSPASIAGIYATTEGSMSTANKLINIGPVTGEVVYYNDNAAGTTHEACTPPINSLAGKIALIDRGTCTFVIKVKNAQDAGAIAVIVVNNVAGLLTMAGDDNSITIPAICISTADGALLKAQLANNLNVTLYGTNIDGDVDNGVIVHEHGHGISTRLTGGPSQPGCLANAEQMGEGWSDYYSLMFTQNWAASNLNTGFTTPRGIGTYVFGQAPSGPGIRTQRYCTDFSINNVVFSASLPANPLTHNRGEIWCATLWDMTWNIINQVGSINPDLYNVAGGGGNTIAMRLVTEGLKLQPCSPGFIDGRNAILQADSILYGGTYSCAIKEAFRRRGMGPNASQGSSNSVTDQVADFTTVPCNSCTSVNTTTQPANQNACTGNNASFTVAVTGTTPVYQWQVSSNGGASYTDIPAATNATLNLTAVTAVMNNNLYRVIISNTCPSADTSAAALLNVADSAAITSQPADITACIGGNASFSVTATGSSNTYQWQVSTDGGLTFTNITGATNPTLNLTGVTTAMNGNQYQALIISGCNPAGITTIPAILTINNTASISGQPANTSACTGGGNATFVVTAAGSSLSYQWQVSTNGGTTFTNIAGANSDTLTLTGVTASMNNNLYQVIVSNTCASSVTSQPALLTVSDPATITSQPASTTVCAGSGASFTVTATGTSNTYQWQVSTDGGITFTDVPGAITSTLNLPGVTAGMDGNQYHLVVTSCSPTGLNSSNVTLTVNSPATITAQTTAVTSCVGNDATFTATVTGTSVTYQWLVSADGGISYNPVPGAITDSLTLNAITAAMNNNLYQVVVNGVCPPADTSAAALLTVINNASITAQPTNATACSGSNVSFTATASGTSYQWQESTDAGLTFNDIPGATTTTLDLIAVTAAMNNNQYRLVVFSCGPTGLNSTAVTLTVNSPANITVQPSDANACIGTTAAFTVTATGNSPGYQWEVSTDGGTTYTPIPAANNATLTLTAVTSSMNNYMYRVIVSNICTTALTSNSASLTIDSVASINAQPVNTNACAGAAASFSVAASGTGLSYQWQVSSDAGANFTNIPGETGVSLTVTGITDAMDNNQYRVIVLDGCSATGVTSDTATLTVYPLPIVTITASPYINLTADLSTTLTATSTPSSTVFTWFKDAAIVSGVTGNTITVNYSDTGRYYASVTDANGCTNNSNLLKIADSSVNTTFIYPNPNTGNFWVRFEGIPYNGQPRLISMYDSKGARVYSQAYVVTSSYQPMNVIAEKLSAGVYMLVLYDVQGNTLATGKVIILQ